MALLFSLREAKLASCNVGGMNLNNKSSDGALSSLTTAESILLVKNITARKDTGQYWLLC